MERKVILFILIILKKRP